MIVSLFIVLAALMVFMAALWALSLRIGNGAVADVGWGLGFILAGFMLMIPARGETFTGWLMTAMVTIWGLRLSFYIWRDRVAGGKPEDARYAEFRQKWGKSANRNLLGFFQLQALLVLIVSLPLALAAGDAMLGFGPVQVAGMALWVAAFAGEVISDRQLKAFKSGPENRGRVCDRGLWRYSRHPNYFFEFILWVALAVMASGARWGWAGFISPVLMLWLLTRVTGIPLAEAQSVKSRGDAFREYQRTTNAFIPWFRKKERSA